MYGSLALPEGGEFTVEVSYSSVVRGQVSCFVLAPLSSGPVESVVAASGK